MQCGRMSVAQRDRQGVGSIRLWGAGQAEQLRDHMLHLGFVCRSGTYHRLLDLSRRVLVHLQPRVHRGDDRSATGLSQLEG